MRIDIELRCKECGGRLYGDIKHTWDGAYLQVEMCVTCHVAALKSEPPEPEDAEADQ